jgi:restriction system protein
MTLESLESILNNVVTLSEERGYWFIRTDSGVNYDNFVKGEFVGVGWNEVTATELANVSVSGAELKAKIAKLYNFDMTLAKGKSKATSVYNKLVHFKNLKQGDLVIIPSFGSSSLAFGIVMDSKIYEAEKPFKDKCDYTKRRRVKWIESKSISSLDSIFYQIIQSRHAICNVKKYESYIDIITENLFIKNNHTHFVLDIKTNEDINLSSLLTLFELVNQLTDRINKELGLNEDVEKISVKLNLQSPGKITFKGAGKALILLASIFASCVDNSSSNTPQNSSNSNGLIPIDTTTKSTLDSTFRQLQIDGRNFKRR